MADRTFLLRHPVQFTISWFSRLTGREYARDKALVSIHSA